jgi:protein dithiol oxidoreductase (disulfide-forming)
MNPHRPTPTSPQTALVTCELNELSSRVHNRRNAMVVAAAGLLVTPWTQAQQVQQPVEGKDFVKLATPVPVPAGPKIDVVEFFWYGCPHCNAFQTPLDAWVKKIPADVNFRRAPVTFSLTHELHAKMYHALEQLGALESVHRRVFTAIHQGRKRLDKESDIQEFVAGNGVDAAKFNDAWRSFGVATKLRQSKDLAEKYRIEGVPALGIHGRFLTAPSMVGGDHYKALATADVLIQRARKPA